MAEETKKAEAAPAPESKVEEVVVPEAEKPSDKDAPPPSEPVKPAEPEAKADEPADDEKKIDQQASFKEETNVVSELPEPQRKALEELRKLVQDALNKRELSAPAPPPPPPKEEEKKEDPPKTEEVAKTEEPPKTEEVAKTEEPPKTEEVAKTEEPPKTEEVAKTEEPPKTEEVAKTEEPPKTEEVAKTEEPPKTEEPAPAPVAEAKAETTTTTTTTTTTEEERTVEAIKETIVEVTPTPETSEPPKEEEKAIEPEPAVEPEEVSIWGIPLLADERSDVILLKFLRARDFKVKEAFVMIRNTVRWRKEFGVDSLLDEDLGNDYEKVVFTHGHDKEGRPVCYNVFGEFQNKELYQNTFADAEKRKKFLRWLIQFLEKTIRTLDFSPKGINSFVLVNDLKNSPGYGKRDLYKVIDKFLQLLQDNYPEFVAKQLCINVSWWYLAYNWIYLTVFTPRSKSKFVFASPSKTPETIFRYIAPEQVPIQFGGHSKVGEHEFSAADPVTEATIKPGSKHPIEFSLSEATELVWELRVIGWDVSYEAEFLPAKEGSYSLNITKSRKVAPTDDPVICDSFKVTEPGKVVITIDNQSSKKKKLLYRSKVKAFA